LPDDEHGVTQLLKKKEGGLHAGRRHIRGSGVGRRVGVEAAVGDLVREGGVDRAPGAIGAG
jgi:hypothetical protein